MDADLKTWLETNKKRLLDACVNSGYALLDIATPKDAPYGRWNNKVVIYADKVPIAQFWLSFRRLHKRSKITSPRFNIETDDQISSKFADAGKH
jgi:hypothetical protein